MRPGSFLLVVAAIATAGTARADERDKALAEALFQSGRTLFEQGKIEPACEKLAASQHIEPKLGTLLNLAMCHERLGKTASAWAEFAEAEAQAERTEQQDRVDFAREHLSELEKRLARVSITGATTVVLKLDGREVDPSIVGTPIPLDPGEHTLQASAPEKSPWSTRFAIAAGPSEQRVEVPVLADAPPAPVVSHDPPKSRARTVAMWTSLGLGVVGFGAGAYFGLHSFAQKSDAEKECNGSACSAAGLTRFDDARTSADVATVSVLVGGALLALGAYLFFSAPHGGTRTAAYR